MKKKIFMSMSFLGALGVTYLISGLHPVTTRAGEGKGMQQEKKEISHQGINLPIRRITKEMENRVTNMIEGVLDGNFEYVRDEAAGLTVQGKKILDNFFPRGQWFMQVEVLNPAETKERRDDFNGYINRMDAQIKEIQKAADSNDEEATLSAITELIKKSCFECHRKYRSK